MPSNRKDMAEEASRIVEHNLRAQKRRQMDLELAKKIIAYAEGCDNDKAALFWDAYLRFSRDSKSSETSAFT